MRHLRCIKTVTIVSGIVFSTWLTAAGGKYDQMDITSISVSPTCWVVSGQRLPTETVLIRDAGGRWLCLI